MTHGSISTGIAGFDIGAEENGIETLWTCEIDPLRQDIIKWRVPNATHYGDIREIKTAPSYVDIISFGFPCQDISKAKRRGLGIDGDKSSLWYEGWRIIRSVNPAFIIIENSPELLKKGLSTILRQIAEAGYDAEWNIISCRQFGMPHLRERLFVIAYSNKIRCQENSRVHFGFHETSLSEQTSEKLWMASEPGRVSRRRDWGEAIRSFHHMDDGIPKNILYGLLAAAGDTVSPRITSWIFSRIKKATYQNKR
jgi:DNA (cytosine-5)-methyltransferase 1